MKINIKKWVTARKSLKKPPEIICGSDTDSPDGIPIKAELFSAEQMERYGQKLAHSHKLSSKKLPYYLLKRLEDNEAVITSNCYLLNAGDKAAMTPAGEWLLDNYYLIEEQIRVVRHHLPKNFGKGLPRWLLRITALVFTTSLLKLSRMQMGDGIPQALPTIFSPIKRSHH